MKKLPSIILAVSICTSVLASTEATAHTQVLSFDVHDDVHNYFYCDVNANDVDVIKMKNHNCKISGFGHNGEFVITSSFTMFKLNHTYFDVIDDKSKSFKLLQNVTIQFDGKNSAAVVCHSGKGGRLFVYGAMWGHG